MRVTEVMSKPVRTIGAHESAGAAWDKMRAGRVRHLVVQREGAVVGVLSDRDLGGRYGEVYRQGRTVADLMAPKVVAIEPRTTVREAANLMRGRKIDCLPVVEGDTVRGIVTSLDLLELIGRGAERPVAKTTRATLRDRGVTPRALAVRKAGSGAKGRVTR